MSTPTAAREIAEELFTEWPLVGRHSHIEELEALLAAAPALAVVRGPTDAGKTTLLAWFSRRAAARGWRSVWAPAPRPQTHKEQMVRSLRAEVGLSERPLEASDRPRGEQLLGRTGAGAEPAAAAPPTEDTLAAGLARTPTVLLIDDYRASESVEDWLLKHLIPELERRQAPVVVVVAGEPDDVRHLASRGSVIDAAPPTESELHDYLRAVGRLLDPPASEAEVNTLSAEAVSRPHLIGPLIRALSYARSDE